MYKTITVGQCPLKGTIVQLCRSNALPAAASVVEQFEANGDWTVPHTREGHFYQAADPNELERSTRAEYGV